MISLKNPADMTAGLFHEHLSNVCIPYFQRVEENRVFADQLGVLMMDSVGAH
jgi:hypothetical protein